MEPSADREPCSSDLPDRVDEALRRAWRGDIAALGAVDRDAAAIADALDSLIHADPLTAMPLADVPGYRVLHHIGSGGMGTIDEAVQLATGRRVALKRLPATAGDDSVREELFEREVRTLARLRHPGIASIVDAGTTPEGGRWFAMELIAGERLDVAARALSLADRVKLLVRIADAIQHAHASLVVHRDLKPANILVDLHGVPRVLDFGLAQAIADRTDAALPARDDGTAGQGTLPYSSPEQALGRPEATHACTDIYALGIVAFELLCGAHPFPKSGISREALQDAIVNQGIPAPRSVAPALDDDLAAIVTKAAALAPDQRYASANEFADDLRRWLRRQPVVARQSSLMHASALFVRRHRALVAAAALSIASLAVGVIATTAMWLRAERANAIGQSMAAFVDHALEPLDPYGFAAANRSLYDVLLTMSTDVDSTTELEPLARARIDRGIGRRFRQLCEYPRADHHLERSVAILMQRAEPDDEDLAASLHELALLRHAEERLTDAGELYVASLAIRDRTLGRADPATIEHREDLSRLHFALGDHAAAIGFAREAFDDAVKNGEPCLIVKYEIELGRRHNDVGDRDAARARLDHALAVARATPGAKDLIAEAIEAAAGFADTPEEQCAQQPLLEEMLALRREVFGDEHMKVADSLATIAMHHACAGDRDRATAAIDEAIRIARACVDEGHSFALNLLEVRGDIHQRLGDHEQAIADRGRVVELLRRRQPPAHAFLCEALCTYATTLQDAGRPAEARAALEEAAATIAPVGAQHPKTMQRVNGLLAEPHFCDHANAKVSDS